MDILTIIIAVCSCLNLILLAVLCIFTVGKDRTKQINSKLSELKTTVESESRENAKNNAVIISTLKNSDDQIKETAAVFSGLKADVLQKMNDINVANSESTIKLMKENSEHFAKLNETLTVSLDKLRAENKESLDKINGTVNEKLQDTLDKKINESFRTVNEQLIGISKGLGEMQSVASNVSDLKKVLSNVKTRGNFGEVQLESVLQDILAPDQYVKQADILHNGTQVDFAIRFPGTDNVPVYLPIDSKFPGDSYEALVDALSSGSREDIERCRKNLQNVIKAEAKSIRDKYISPPATMDLAIMFLSSEGLYSEIVSTPGLVAELQTMRINVAGPSTMSAMLNSFRIGFQALRMQQKSVEIQRILEAAKKEFGRFGTELDGMRKNLKLTESKLDSLIGTRTNAINRALRGITELSDDDLAGKLIDSVAKNSDDDV